MYTTVDRFFHPIGLALALLLSFGALQFIEARDYRTLTTLQVANLSSRIVWARCRAVDVRQTEGGIFTFSEFEVLRVVRGSLPGDHLTLRLIGGRVGDVQIRTPFVPKFTPGEEVVLFLGRDNPDGYPTIFIQGVFRVRTHPMNGEKVVVPAPTDLLLFRASNDTAYPAPPDLTPLEDFLFSLKKLK